MADLAATLKERGSRHGEFRDHACYSQSIKAVMQSSPNWEYYMEDMHHEALEMIAHKIGRILAGDPNYADNWHDIAGYAKLVDDRLQPPPPEPAPQAESEPAPEPETPRPCRALQQGSFAPYICTLDKGHEGDHMAHGFTNEGPYAVWPQDDED